MARGTAFKDQTTLEEMLVLRMTGATYTDLGRRYGVDHTTIIYHCKRAGIGTKDLQPTKQKRKERVTYTKRQPIPQRVLPLHKMLQDERINPGKTYAEYVEDARKRRLKYYAHLRSLPTSTAKR